MPRTSAVVKSVSMPQRLRPTASARQDWQSRSESSHPQLAQEIAQAKHFSGVVSSLTNVLKPVHWLLPASIITRKPFTTSISAMSFVAATMLFCCLSCKARSFCLASRTPAALDFGSGLAPPEVAPKRVHEKWLIPKVLENRGIKAGSPTGRLFATWVDTHLQNECCTTTFRYYTNRTQRIGKHLWAMNGPRQVHMATPKICQQKQDDRHLIR